MTELHLHLQIDKNDVNNHQYNFDTCPSPNLSENCDTSRDHISESDLLTERTNISASFSLMNGSEISEISESSEKIAENSSSLNEV
jgi:hypothetical protein